MKKSISMPESAIPDQPRPRRQPISYEESGDFQILQPSELPIWSRVLRSYVRPFRNCSAFVNSLLGFFPWIQWLPRYSLKHQLLGDLIAGVAVGIVSVTQGITYALLAGIPAVSGFYTGALASLVYPLFGSWPHGSMGPFAITELMSGAAARRVLRDYHQNSNHSIAFYSHDFPNSGVDQQSIVSTLTFVNGVVCILFAVFRLRFLVDHFSKPLVGGFMAAVAFHVAIEELDTLVGVSILRASGTGHIFVELGELYTRLSQTNYATLLVSGVSFVFLIVGELGLGRALKLLLPKRQVVIPSEFLLVITSTFVTWFWELDFRYNLRTVGFIPRDLPPPELPKFEVVPLLLWDSVIIAIVQITFQHALAKKMSALKGYAVDEQQETYAIGAVMITTGFFPVFPPTVGLGRPMILDACGGSSQISGLISGLFVLFVLLVVSPLLFWLPLCVLSVIVLFGIRSLIGGFVQLPNLWRTSKWDFSIWMVTFVASMTVDVITGLVLGLVFQLFTVVVRTQSPGWKAKFSKRKDLMNVCVFEFHSSLLFSNANQFQQVVRQVIGTWNSTGLGRAHRTFIFDCSSISTIDFVGLEAFRLAIADLGRAACSIAIAAVQPNVLNSLEQTGIVSDDNYGVFRTVEDAIWRARAPILHVPLVASSSNPFEPGYEAETVSAIPFTSL